MRAYAETQMGLYHEARVAEKEGRSAAFAGGSSPGAAALQGRGALFGDATLSQLTDAADDRAAASKGPRLHSV
jgi:hypothetical protein